MTFLLLVLQFLIVFKVTEGKTNSTITNTNSNSKVSKYTHYETHYFTEKMYLNYRFKFIVFFLIIIIEYTFKFQVNVIAMVNVSVTVKTVILNVPLVYLDGADLPKISAKNVQYTHEIQLYFKQQLCDKYIKFYVQKKTFHYKMTSFYFRERVFPPKCNG